MAILLSDLQVTVQDHLAAQVIDEFRKNNYLLDNMPFDNAVSPTGGGTTMTYTYARVKTQATAAVREINAEYTAQEAKKERKSVDLKIFGGSFAIDRVLANMGGVVDEVQFQMDQKIKATQALFSDMVINGDKDSHGFDGLKKALTGTDGEMTSEIDLSSSANINTNYLAFLDEVDAMLGKLDGPATALLVGPRMRMVLRACARRATMYQTTKDNWGQEIERYGNTPIIDLGAKAGSNDPIISDNEIYAVRLGMDGLHGVTVADTNSMFKTWMPDFSTAGAVKHGEVEMIAAVALKASKAAAVLKGVVA